MAVGGDDQHVLVHERPDLRAVLDEPDLAARLAKLAVVNTEIMRRTARLHLAVRGAAVSDPAPAAMLAEITASGLRPWQSTPVPPPTGQLAVSEEECRDVLWSTSDGSLWHGLVQQRAWSDERYAAWLGRLWVSMLVAQGRSATAPPC